MSDTGTDTTTETGIVIEPRPPAVATSDRFALPSTYKFVPRQVLPSTQALVGSGPGYEERFFAPTIGPTPPGKEKFLLYSGSQLVNERGVIVRGQYDPDEAYGLLASLSKAERMTLQNELYSRGLYDNSKPSTSGFDTQDITAMKQYLLFANRYGVTAEGLRSPALAYLRTDYPMVEKSGGIRIRSSSKEDIREYVNRDSLELLGRTLTRAEFRQALQMIQARERAPRAGETQASLGALSAQAVGQIAPREVQVNDAADAIDIFREMLRTARG